MTSDPSEMDDLALASILEPDERPSSLAATRDAVIVATDRRLAILMDQRLALDIPYERLRRIQFDIERTRPATLVIVPDRPTDEPQVISVRAEEYAAVADVLVAVGIRLADS